MYIPPHGVEVYRWCLPWLRSTCCWRLARLARQDAQLVEEISLESVSAGYPAQDNERNVHHIRTSTRYADGSREVRHGTGFVVGNRFVTVYHNVDVHRGRGSFQRRIELGGMVVEPAIVDAPNDIAIFNVPEELCATWCNDRVPARISVELQRAQPIGWFEFVAPDSNREWRQARVLEVMFKNYRGSDAPTVCDSDVVIAVDKPFYPGSSGGPVWDLASNRLLGMVQGSFVRESGEQVGYYKPLACVLSLMTGRMGPQTVELASAGTRPVNHY